jgi:serine/threonine protein kinase
LQHLAVRESPEGRRGAGGLTIASFGTGVLGWGDVCVWAGGGFLVQRGLMRQLLEGVADCHRRNITHRDLKVRSGSGGALPGPSTTCAATVAPHPRSGPARPSPSLSHHALPDPSARHAPHARRSPCLSEHAGALGQPDNLILHVPDGEDEGGDDLVLKLADFGRSPTVSVQSPAT